MLTSCSLREPRALRVFLPFLDTKIFQSLLGCDLRRQYVRRMRASDSLLELEKVPPSALTPSQLGGSKTALRARQPKRYIVELYK